MDNTDKLIDDMESITSVFLRYQVTEAVFQGSFCRVEVRLHSRDTVCSVRESAATGVASDPGVRREERPMGPAQAPGKRRCVLLRSPAVGLWHPASDGAAAEGGGGKIRVAGVVRAILGDEMVAAPREGRLLLELAEEASLVGFGDPLAFWEVA
ncbi:MAG: hypothetical protein HPY75_10085 [Actinobacteria bacterium]|nr:hypothetical protein [Actinomycetota bacterium]